ncbi:hypothetical protein FFI89_017385 [Bradyrhizobium sp. KBS0727]|uniref:hypothetical protein n=1 Tax=unclassified Bradyrhizobium TaxID=2631580 RepID=UPI00110E7E02|nr:MULTISPECIES: hypothetical protein [unclassified Bradyrhizobium]QDW38761.1 hypothetical protein FFI71_017380 [Bradyrhizobium sp. KBS0725]QDW45365.1 hypothetical protein FFI89_017385 [Bradyrhizobium sp. KBS0727]
MMLPAPARFDYDAVPAVTAKALRAQASRIRKTVSGATKAIIEIGCDLIAVKQSLVERGHFRDWVEAECGLKLRTAENYMRAAQFAEGRNATVALLNPGIVYRLAAKSALAEIVQSVLDRAANGEVVSDGSVIAAFDEARFQKQEAERLQKQANRRVDSKKTLARREAGSRRYDEGQRKENERRRQTALLIIDGLGQERSTFLIDSLPHHEDWRILEILRREVDKRREVAA